MAATEHKEYKKSKCDGDIEPGQNIYCCVNNICKNFALCLFCAMEHNKFCAGVEYDKATGGVLSIHVCRSDGNPEVKVQCGCGEVSALNGYKCGCH